MKNKNMSLEALAYICSEDLGIGRFDYEGKNYCIYGEEMATVCPYYIIGRKLYLGNNIYHGCSE